LLLLSVFFSSHCSCCFSLAMLQRTLLPCIAASCWLCVLSTRGGDGVVCISGTNSCKFEAAVSVFTNSSLAITNPEELESGAYVHCP
jgi:hypothetical protein